MTTPTQVRIDADIKQQASDLFEMLGLDMSTAVNLFLHQCVLKGGLLFPLKPLSMQKKRLPRWKKQKVFPVILP